MEIDDKPVVHALPVWYQDAMDVYRFRSLERRKGDPVSVTAGELLDKFELLTEGESHDES